MFSAGGNDGARVSRVGFFGSPEGSLHSSIDCLGAPRGQNNFNRFCIQHGSDALSGVLEHGASPLACLVNRGRIPHHIKSLTIGLLDRLRHGAGGLVIEINAHGGS